MIKYFLPIRLSQHVFKARVNDTFHNGKPLFRKGLQPPSSIFGVMFSEVNGDVRQFGSVNAVS